jgi:hypothetical protein
VKTEILLKSEFYTPVAWLSRSLLTIVTAGQHGSQS